MVIASLCCSASGPTHGPTVASEKIHRSQPRPIGVRAPIPARSHETGSHMAAGWLPSDRRIATRPLRARGDAVEGPKRVRTSIVHQYGMTELCDGARQVLSCLSRVLMETRCNPDGRPNGTQRALKADSMYPYWCAINMQTPIGVPMHGMPTGSQGLLGTRQFQRWI